MSYNHNQSNNNSNSKQTSDLNSQKQLSVNEIINLHKRSSTNVNIDSLKTNLDTIINNYSNNNNQNHSNVYSKSTYSALDVNKIIQASKQQNHYQPLNYTSGYQQSITSDSPINHLQTTSQVFVDQSNAGKFIQDIKYNQQKQDEHNKLMGMVNQLLTKKVTSPKSRVSQYLSKDDTFGSGQKQYVIQQNASIIEQQLSDRNSQIRGSSVNRVIQLKEQDIKYSSGYYGSQNNSNQYKYQSNQSNQDPTAVKIAKLTSSTNANYSQLSSTTYNFQTTNQNNLTNSPGLTNSVNIGQYLNQKGTNEFKVENSGSQASIDHTLIHKSNHQPLDEVALKQHHKSHFAKNDDKAFYSKYLEEAQQKNKSVSQVQEYTKPLSISYAQEEKINRIVDEIRKSNNFGSTNVTSSISINQNNDQQTINNYRNIIQQQEQEIQLLKEENKNLLQKLKYYESMPSPSKQPSILQNQNKVDRDDNIFKKIRFENIQNQDSYLENITMLDTPLTLQDENFLNQTLIYNQIFQDLDKDSLSQLIKQIKLCDVAAGQYVFKQGDMASNFFIIQKGNINVIKDNQFKKALKEGESFGELALLYEAPRAASIQAISNCRLYVLNRNIFKNAIRKIAAQNLADNLDIINKIQLFSCLNKQQMTTLAQSFVSIKVKKGESIVELGDDANCFFIIKSGEAEVLSQNREQLKILKKNDTFGDSALSVQSSKRNATIKALSDCSLLSLGREQLLETLGDDINNIRQRKQIQQAIANNSVLKAVTQLQTEKIINEILKNAKQVKAGQVVLQKGSIVRKIYVVLEGCLMDSLQQKVCESSQIFAGIFGENYLANPNLLPIQNDIFMQVDGQLAEIDFSVINSILGVQNFGDFQNQKEFNHETLMLSSKNQNKRKFLNELFYVKKLGQGAFGTVLLGMKKDTKQEYAIKCISKQSVVEQKIENLLKLEKKVMEQISNPFIMEYYFSDKDSHFIYFILSYIQGKELFDIIYKDHGKLNSYHAKFYAAQIILALEYLHNHNIVHRDLKPENLMLNKNGYLQLIDMGLAKILDAKDFNSRCYTFVGTPVYMAPEIFQNKGYSFEIDLWALGCMIYEFFTVQVPFGQGASDPMQIYSDIQNKEVKFPANFNDEYAKQIIVQLLNKQPARRLGGSYSRLKAHPWFDDLQWDKLYHQQLLAPYLPKVGSTSMTPSFDINKSSQVQDVAHKLIGAKKHNPAQDTVPGWDADF